MNNHVGVNVSLRNDRQIRLWGDENDVKLRNCRVLIFNIINRKNDFVLLIEILKNLVLSGVAHIDICDIKHVDEGHGNNELNSTFEHPIFGSSLDEIVVNVRKLGMDANVSVNIVDEESLNSRGGDGGRRGGGGGGGGDGGGGVLENASIVIFTPMSIEAVQYFISNDFENVLINNCPLIVSNVILRERDCSEYKKKYFYKLYLREAQIILDSHTSYYNELMNLRLSSPTENPVLSRVYVKYQSQIDDLMLNGVTHKPGSIPYPLVFYAISLYKSMNKEITNKAICEHRFIKNHEFLVDSIDDSNGLGFPRFWNYDIDTMVSLKYRDFVYRLKQFYGVYKRLPVSDSKELMDSIYVNRIDNTFGKNTCDDIYDDLIREYQEQFKQDCMFFHSVGTKVGSMDEIPYLLRNLHKIDFIYGCEGGEEEEEEEEDDNVNVKGDNCYSDKMYVQDFKHLLPSLAQDNDKKNPLVPSFKDTYVTSNLVGAIISQEVTKLITNNFTPLKKVL